MAKKMGLALVALVMMLAACGGGGGLSAEEQAFADQMVAQMTSDTSAANPFGEEEAARCYAEAAVGEFGVEKLSSSTWEPNEGEMGTLVDLAVDCIDIGGVIAGYMISEMAMPEEQANAIGACVAEDLDDDLTSTLAGAFLSGEDLSSIASNPDLAPIVAACLMEGAG